MINPYSNSNGVDDEFWIDLINLLNKNGYNVYINYKNIYPEKISNERVIYNPYNEVIGMIDKFKFVISIRSGFCDGILDRVNKLYVINGRIDMYYLYNLDQWFPYIEGLEHKIKQYIYIKKNDILKDLENDIIK